MICEICKVDEKDYYKRPKPCPVCGTKACGYCINYHAELVKSNGHRGYACVNCSGTSGQLKRPETARSVTQHEPQESTHRKDGVKVTHGDKLFISLKTGQIEDIIRNVTIVDKQEAAQVDAWAWRNLSCTDIPIQGEC